MGMILRIASSRIVGQGDIVGRSGYFSLNLSANSVMRGRLDARRTLKSLVADLRSKTEKTKKLWEKRITENTTLSMESVQWMAQRINSLLEYMRYGYALIAYRKQDGSFYMGRGTLVSYESDFKKKHDMTSIKAHVAYWDAEQQGWRTFLIENFMEWRPIVN